jgi:hypothetical protein
MGKHAVVQSRASRLQLDRRGTSVAVIAGCVLAVGCMSPDTSCAVPNDDACWNRLRDYAHRVNSGDFAGAHAMMVPVVGDIVSESQLKELSTWQVAGGAGLDAETAKAMAALGARRAEQILLVEKPEIHGRNAIAGLIVADNPERLSQSVELRMYRDAEWVRTSGLPTWGEQLAVLGYRPEDCNLVDHLADRLGDADKSFWPIVKRWVVASLDKEGQWRVWPQFADGRTLAFRMDLNSRDIAYTLDFEGGRLRGPGPWTYPKPSVNEISYARWFAAEMNPGKCPSCAKYVRSVWEFCPYCGARLRGASDAASAGRQEPNP